MNIYDQLKRDEGSKNFPYTDTVGKLTIGVGRNLTDRGISEDELETLLLNDVKIATGQLAGALPWYAALDEARRGVLLNMAFNMGISGLLGFHRALSFMENGEYDKAADEILASKWAVQVGARASRLATQLRSGEWQ